MGGLGQADSGDRAEHPSEMAELQMAAGHPAEPAAGGE